MPMKWITLTGEPLKRPMSLGALDVADRHRDSGN